MSLVRFSRHHRSFLTLTLATTLIGLAACSVPPPAPAGTSASAAPTAEQPASATQLTGEITHMQWNASPAIDETLQEQAREFERTHPGTKVNVTLLPYDQYQQKLTLLLSTNTPPDAFEMPGDALRLVQEGQVVPLEEYFKADPVLNDPAQVRIEANDMAKFKDGQVYATQAGALCSMQLYYNQELFDKAGVAHPNENWTWDDFVDAAKKLTIRQGDETTQWGTDLGYLAGWDGGWQWLAASYGAKIFDTNFDVGQLDLKAPEVVKALQQIQDLVYTNKVAPPPSARDALGQAGGPFQSGKVAMVLDGCWMLSTYKEAIPKLGMSILPKGNTHVHPVWYAGGYFIASASKNKALTWEWLRWLAVDQKANEMMAKAGLNCGAPIVRKYDELYSAAWKSVPGGEACVKSLETAKFFQVYDGKWQEMYDSVIAPQWDKYMNGTMTAQQFVDAVNDKANAMIK